MRGTHGERGKAGGTGLSGCYVQRECRVKTRDTRGSLRARARPRPGLCADVLLTRRVKLGRGNPCPKCRASGRINTGIELSTRKKRYGYEKEARFSETASENRGGWNRLEVTRATRRNCARRDRLPDLPGFPRLSRERARAPRIVQSQDSIIIF